MRGGARHSADRGYRRSSAATPVTAAVVTAYGSAMSFAVGADAYDRFMGRYSARLAPRFADFAEIRPGRRVLDVGCGPGALTAELVARVGGRSVSAVDPSETFVAEAMRRHPDVDVRRASTTSNSSSTSWSTPSRASVRWHA